MSMTGYPAGTVSFLFTDIEGSTKLAREHPHSWETARARHHEILRKAIEQNNGYVFQIIGDAFCAAFHTVGDAIRAAIQSQTDLYREGWRDVPIKVRMGIHSGKAEIQPDGEYHGYLAMSRIQRLMSAGHGGQVLISAAAQELLREDLPENVSLRDLGERRLKDMIHPEHIFQLLMPGLPVDFPPLKTLDFYRHNLPVQMTTFIGREKIIEEVKQATARNRLVTLTGSGGSGKTRLSLQVAADLLDQFPDGVWFVDLAPLANPDLIPQAILSALKLSEQASLTVLQLLLDYLPGRRILLILDNCEHLIEACSQLADQFLSQAHALHILATSREGLGVQGEVIWPVPSLSLPDARQLPALEDFSQYEAIHLFIDRAMLVQPHFQMTKENALAIAQICLRLDGIPLAIELAAARVRSLGVEQINKRLDDRFRLLTGGSRTVLEHHQTLRATIDWSYNLLSDQEKLLLCRLSVFAGGWVLEAAEQVCANEHDNDSMDVLDLLTHLVEKSLVMLEEKHDSVRYHLLETTRQYALEKLIDAGEDRTAYDQHFAYFLRLAEEAENQLIGSDQVEWLNRLEREYDNFRTALEWSRRKRTGEDALRLAGALGLFWLKHSHFSEGRNWLVDLLNEYPNASESLQLKALRWAGFMAFWQTDITESRRLYTQSLEREQAFGGRWGFTFSLHMLANIEYLEGDVEKAKELHKKSMALSREINAIWVLALSQFSLGDMEYSQGNIALAEELSNEALKNFRQLGEKFLMGRVMSNLGYILSAKGDFPATRKIFLEALGFTRELGDKDGMAMILNGLAGVFRNEGQPIISAQLQGAAISLIREVGASLSMMPMENATFDLTAKALKEVMGEQEYQTEFEMGMSLRLDDVLCLVSAES